MAGTMAQQVAQQPVARKAVPSPVDVASQRRDQVRNQLRGMPYEAGRRAMSVREREAGKQPAATEKDARKDGQQAEKDPPPTVTPDQVAQHIQNRCEAYKGSMQCVVESLLASIDAAKENVQGITSLKDPSSLLQSVFTSSLVGVVGMVPGLAGVAGALSRLGAGKVASEATERVLADTAKGTATAALKRDDGSKTTFAGLQVAHDALVMKHVLLANWQAEGLALSNLSAHCNLHRELCTPDRIDAWNQLVADAPKVAKDPNQAAVRGIEGLLWLEWIAQNCAIQDTVGARNVVYSRKVVGMSEAVQTYLKANFPTFDVEAILAKKAHTSAPAHDGGPGGWASK